MAEEYRKLSLNGDWIMDYLGAEPYTDEAEPVSEGFPVAGAVPGYWEDMVDKFRESPLHAKLQWNPKYTLQRYPQAGYVPDMALPNVMGCLSYTRTFRLAAVTAEEVRLFIGGAQNAVSVWINGGFIGRHEGYSASFSFHVPKELLKTGENRITLAVSNTRLQGYLGRPVSGCTSRAANECTGGIYGDVELRAYDGALRDLWVTTDADLAHFTVHTEGAADKPAAVRILDGDRTVACGEIPAGENQLSIPTGGLSFWSPECPRRYTVEVTCGGQTLLRKFGIRRLTAEGTSLLLNGEPFYVRGICEHGYYPLTAHPPRDKNYYRKVIRTIKGLGFNFIRFHTWVPMEEYMDAADELGILMEVETPNNTTWEEWGEIVRDCRRHTAPVAYSSGNEMVIDEDYIEHLSRCAATVHDGSDSLFSPMSAMRGIEYFSYGNCQVDEPFPHNPVRLGKLGEFCDLYNSYSLGLLSYISDQADHNVLDERNAIYKKPILSHEICINGTYCDLSLKDRYRGTRIGDTELFTSVERHLADKGLLDRANLYYRNSSEWQRRLRKDCFESTRRCETIAGYDYLGDIDHHWHTFGYCVGMMNEFYELKPGETAANVRRYNSDTVLLADLPRCVNFTCGEKVEIPLLVSHFGKALEKASLQIRLSDGHRVFLRKEIRTGSIPAGKITELYRLAVTMPRSEKPLALKLTVSLSGGDTDAENQWELYVFPKTEPALPAKKVLKAHRLTVTGEMDANTLLKEMEAGRKVLLLGTGPFAALDTSFQISLAGRTEGHLATVINDTPLMEDFPHEGFCGWQFRSMLNDGRAVVLDSPQVPYTPVIEIASAYKNARKEALIFEYRVGEGSLLCCSLHLDEADPAARWLKARLITYAMGGEFAPEQRLTAEQLIALCSTKPIRVTKNTNEAKNANDITM